MKVFFVVRYAQRTPGSSRSVQFSHWLKHFRSETQVIHEKTDTPAKTSSAEQKPRLLRLKKILMRILILAAPVSARAYRRKKALAASFFKSCAGSSRDRDAVLFTVSKPDVTHLAGLEIKRKTGLFWAAFFGDPWTENSYAPLQAVDFLIQRGYERKVVKNADMLFFPTEEFKDRFMSRYPEQKDKAFVTLHSFDPELFPESSGQKENGLLQIHHIGHFYGPRNPFELIEAFHNFLSTHPEKARIFRFEFTGRAPDGLEDLPGSWWKEFFIFHPSVEYEEGLRRMKQADCLLTIDAATRENIYRPAKLAEYIGAERPIWAVTPRRSPAETFLKKLPGSYFSHPGNKESFLEVLHALYENRGGKTLPQNNSRSSLYNTHTAAAVVSALENQLKIRLIAHRSRLKND